MKKINVVATLIAVSVIFSGSFLYARSQAKAPEPKKGNNQVVIEFVSFPDQYKNYEVYPWETLKLDDFQRSFSAMTREGKFEDWVMSLTGTAMNKNRMIQAFRQRFLLIVSCKPHLCDASQIVVLYDPVRKHAYGLLAVDGKFHFFGQPPDNIRDLLNILLVEEFKAIYRGQR
ncbi:MAG: Ivy family c-type lysozyme inhibitor [Syntrophorhabdaceae bacterium]|nr:inhibitor of vertebrate lysozyme family protein [Syntrophorhabdaceae bacterium]MDD4195751.1 Ivy family c-type lysozyme inhibitor [Syntrophorhabdaceae bacterium]HOC46745.1 Ivy family c-type lysozyme inhibitor [Syntrophorhabdaceae bacterium]